MLQLLGLPLILAAWTLPALFVLTLAALFTYAIMRPVYLAWAFVFDTTVHWVERQLAGIANLMAARSAAYAVRHTDRS
jgi:hypothetical protein